MKAVMFVLITTSKALAHVAGVVAWVRARRANRGVVARAGEYVVGPRTPSFSSVNWPTRRGGLR